MMGFAGGVIGVLWLFTVAYLVTKAVIWVIFQGGARKIFEAFRTLVRQSIFVYWELPLRKITGRPVHAKVLTMIEKLENDLGYRNEYQIPGGLRSSGLEEDLVWFQQAHGLTPDGKIGPKTLAVLKMVDHKRRLVGGMIGAQEYQWIEDEAVIQLNRIFETPRPDFNAYEVETMSQWREVKRIRRNGS
jgi:hypothetical protein